LAPGGTFGIIPRPMPNRSPRWPRAVFDPHLLYERAVQDPAVELRLLERLLRRRGVAAARLREDFSGTALLATRWVERGPERTAVAVDLDPAVHAWARANRVRELGAAAERLTLVTGDVRQGPRGPFEAVVALNFSWMVLADRAALGGWLRRVRESLAPGGILVMDAFGGWDAQKVLQERRRIGGGVRYVWEQESFDPITHRIRCAITFELPGRKKPRRAFTYDWRLWTLPEVRELCEEAGFDDVEVLWDVAPTGSTRYVPRAHVENQPGWLAYVVAGRKR
jgi:SAM-dependent methyltransferase